MKSSSRPWRFVSRIGVGGTLLIGASFGVTAGITALGTGVASAACGNSTETVCPAISLSNTSPNAGDTETITGTGYDPNVGVTVMFDSTTLTATVRAGGAVAGSNAVLASDITLDAAVTTDGNGNFTASFTIPSTAAAGTHTVTATDADNQTASATLTVVNSATTTTGTGTSSTGTTASTGSGSTLPVTGADTTKGLLVAADLALLGTPLLIISRRRRRA